MHTNRARIELSFLLPTLPDAQDGCVRRLVQLLESHLGIKKVHFVPRAGQSPQLCIHFDANATSAGEVRSLAERAGARLTEQYGHILFKSQSMHPRRASAIARRLEKIPGVLEAVVNSAGTVRVEFERSQIAERQLFLRCRQLGLNIDSLGDVSKVVVAQVSKEQHLAKKPADSSEAIAVPLEQPTKAQAKEDEKVEGDEHDHAHGGILGANTEIVFAICGGICLLVGWLLEIAGIALLWSLPLYILAFVLGGIFTLREAIENVRSGRFQIDSLMLLAAVGAAIIGAWAEGALLLFLFSLGHALENYAMGRAKKAIEALAKLAPQTALVGDGSQLKEVAIEQLRIGDIVVIKPNERIPADGFVVQGESSVNQAPITGESVPIDKRPVKDVAAAAAKLESLDAFNRVFAGTINQSGALEVQVSRLATDSTLSRVVRMVSEAETQQSPTQRFTDKFEQYFVPGIIAVVLMLLFAPWVIDETLSKSFYRAMAVLVAASPCALAISTPSAVLSGIERDCSGGAWRRVDQRWWAARESWQPYGDCFR